MKNGQCLKCGSKKIIAGVPIYGGSIDENHKLAAMIVEKPASLLLTSTRTFPMRAWICSECGFAEFYVNDPQALDESYKRFRQNSAS